MKKQFTHQDKTLFFFSLGHFGFCFQKSAEFQLFRNGTDRSRGLPGLPASVLVSSCREGEFAADAPGGVACFSNSGSWPSWVRTTVCTGSTWLSLGQAAACPRRVRAVWGRGGCHTDQERVTRSPFRSKRLAPHAFVTRADTRHACLSSFHTQASLTRAGTERGRNQDTRVTGSGGFGPVRPHPGPVGGLLFSDVDSGANGAFLEPRFHFSNLDQF